jgi:hypothetical protein
MADDSIYIEFVNEQTVTGGTVASKYRVNLSPAGNIEDTYKNSLDIVQEEDIEIDPESIVINTKRISHIITVTGTLKVITEDGDLSVPVTKLMPNPDSVEGMQDPTSKYGRFRALQGYGDLQDLTLTLYINGISFTGTIGRFSCFPTAGNIEYADYILEFIEGTVYTS